MNFVVAVCLGILLGNVWALVGGTIAGNIISFIVSYVLHDYRPGFDFDFDLARELIDFGKWIFGGSVARFLQNQGDDVFVGWLLGATPLAFYQMAYRFSNAPATELTSVINKVTFPSLSQVQDDAQKLRSGYFRTLRFNAFLALPATAGIALVAPSFVMSVLGANWIQIVPVLQALAVWGGIRAIGGSNGPVFLTLSRPDIDFKLTLVRVSLIALVIYPAATRFGVLGVAGTLIGAGLLVIPLGVFLTLRLIDASARRYVGCLVHPLIGSGVMAAALFALGAVLPTDSALLELIVFVVTGSVVYFSYIYIAASVFEYRIRDDLRPILQSLRG